MSGDEQTIGTDPAPTTAGGLLRQARLSRGLHIAALAASIKVTPQKLEMLETDRLDQLPGHAFARALAQTVCRFLKIDPAPVMALLPAPPGHGLERMSRGLNEPFRDSPGRRAPSDVQFLKKNPVLLGAVGILLAATVVFLLPRQWLSEHLPHLGTTDAAPTSAPAVGSSTGPSSSTSETVVPTGAAVLGEATGAGPGASASLPAVATVSPFPDAASAQQSSAAEVPAPALVPSPSVQSQATEPAVAAASSVPVTSGLQLKASAPSWVEVTDKRGISLLARRLQAGETVTLDGVSPLRVKIGNASATQLSFNGQPVDLGPVTSRGNVARIELR